MKTIKLLLLLLLSFQAGNVYADQEEVPYGFYEGQEVYVLADSVNLREEASTSSKSMAIISIGTKVRILKETEVQLNLNGFTMNWYYVEISPKKRGYVWGGKLARNSFRSNKNTDFVFHFGLEKIVDDQAYYQIRVEKNHKEVQRVTLRGFGAASKEVNFTNRANCGLTNVDDILYMEGWGEFCGDEGGAEVLFFSGEKLWSVQRLGRFADVPYFASEEFIFPCDMNGVKGKILLHEEIGENVFPEDDPSITEQTIRYEKNETTTYVWDGKKLVKK